MITDLFGAWDQPGFSSLEYLDISGTYLNSDGISALANAIQAGKLPALTLLSIAKDDTKLAEEKMLVLEQCCLTRRVSFSFV